ncbi:F-box/kelch-repeat protein [Dendrobium catenatum]|uniref:F-box/kelch-repeat protein n=1 Tax=Dendrobium catenatum TaxID=906689 RepID=A0A2I0WA06_9ASPA|nr:F-box/kelch-repeat protein [Dendrobium catenatum]
MLCVSWCDYDGLLNRREKAVRKMWELDLKSNSWSEVSRHPDAPMDWNASFFADQNKIYGVEMFRIFGQVLDFVTACNVSDSEIKYLRRRENGIGEQAKPKKKALPHANDNEEESPTSVKLKIREGKLMIWNGRYCSSASFLLSRAKLVRSILLQRFCNPLNLNGF